MTASYRFRVNGRVQGVSFRYCAQQRALELGLSGWIANQPDGSVVGEAQGAEESLALFERWLGSGPAQAQVTALDWQSCPSEVAVTDRRFEIRR